MPSISIIQGNLPLFFKPLFFKSLFFCRPLFCCQLRSHLVLLYLPCFCPPG